MSRGGSAGGGQSSLGYLFGGSEPPKPAVARATPAPAVPAAPAPVAPAASAPAAPAAPAPVAPATSAPAASAPAEKAAHAKADVSKQIPAGIQGSRTNNYHRADGQNTGNFLTDRPSTKVHSAPGGHSTLDYLFGGK